MSFVHEPLKQIDYLWQCLSRAVSMTKCKKRSMVLPEIERIRGEQLRGTLEAQ
jgi:hypothetical protein